MSASDKTVASASTSTTGADVSDDINQTEVVQVAPPTSIPEPTPAVAVPTAAIAGPSQCQPTTSSGFPPCQPVKPKGVIGKIAQWAEEASDDLLVAFDVMTGLDSVPCNACDLPQKDEPGIFEYMYDLVLDIVAEVTGRTEERDRAMIGAETEPNPCVPNTTPAPVERKDSVPSPAAVTENEEETEEEDGEEDEETDEHDSDAEEMEQQSDAPEGKWFEFPDLDKSKNSARRDSFESDGSYDLPDGFKPPIIVISGPDDSDVLEPPEDIQDTSSENAEDGPAFEEKLENTDEGDEGVGEEVELLSEIPAEEGEDNLESSEENGEDTLPPPDEFEELPEAENPEGDEGVEQEMDPNIAPQDTDTEDEAPPFEELPEEENAGEGDEVVETENNEPSPDNPSSEAADLQESSVENTDDDAPPVEELPEAGNAGEGDEAAVEEEYEPSYVPPPETAEDFQQSYEENNEDGPQPDEEFPEEAEIEFEDEGFDEEEEDESPNRAGWPDTE